jgi:8-oxo-dGTP pyrophosphatase MutT (NUDIX family)
VAHPGGPLFVNKDDGAWSIPKGEPDAGEDLLVTAQREFEEETGVKPQGPFISLKTCEFPAIHDNVLQTRILIHPRGNCYLVVTAGGVV